MATRGRPPRPAEQKELVGRSPGRDSGGRPLPEVVVELPGAADVPAVPPELETARTAGLCSYAEAIGGGCEICREELAAVAWRELWTNGRTWLSMARDRRVLIRLCQAYAEEAHLRITLAEDGPFVKGQRGGLVAHPAVSMLRALEDRITRWEGLCGFNPSDGGRLGVKVTKERGRSPLEELLERRAAARAERGNRAADVPQRRGRAARATGTD
jgi:P27 family predicted phage terminase small subunit